MRIPGHGGVLLHATDHRPHGETRGTVVLLHGGGQTRHAWGGTAMALAARGLRAVTVDLRGHGDSEWAADGDYSYEAFSADVAALCDHLGRPAVVGASLGGISALIAEGGTRAHSIMSALVLVDIAPRLEPEGVARVLGFMTAWPDGFASLEDAADAIAGYMPHRPRPKDLSGLSKNLRLGDDGRWRWHWDPRFMSGDRRPNAHQRGSFLLDCARNITVPALLVRGRMSDIVSEEGVREFLETVPHAEFVDVSGAGHMVAGDRNDAFTDAVAEFLVRVTV